MNILSLVPDSTLFKLTDLNGRIVKLEYKEAEHEKEILKLLTARDVNTHEVYIIFYEIGKNKEDC